MKELGSIKYDSISWEIVMSVGDQFGMIFALREASKVEIKLPYRFESTRIHKIVKMGSLYVHVFLITEKDQIDTGLLNWIQESMKFFE
jgi:hypothetical protein